MKTSRSIRFSCTVRATRRCAGALALVVGFGAATAWAGDGRHGAGRAPRPHAVRAGAYGNTYGPHPMRQEREGRGAAVREAQQPVPPPMQPAMPAAMPQAAPMERPPEPAARPGRLTPDERRALRQQINDAGRDLYQAPRP